MRRFAILLVASLLTACGGGGGGDAADGSAPSATTLAATSVGLDTATVNGSVTPNGLPTSVWFEWGTDPALSGSGVTASQTVDPGTIDQPLNAVLAGLSGETTYYYRIAARNAAGTTKGAILSFTTVEVAPAAWTVTGSMGTTRPTHTATLLGNGKVLVAGGYSDNLGYLNSAELYDAATGTFSATASMESARSSHTATRLADGRVLVVGGQDTSTTDLSSAELYFPGTEE